MLSGSISARANKSHSLSMTVLDDYNDDEEEEKEDEAEAGINKLTLS